MSKIRFFKNGILKRILEFDETLSKLVIKDGQGNVIKDLEEEVTTVKKKFIKIKSINESAELVYEEDGVEKTVPYLPDLRSFVIYVEDSNSIVFIDDSPSVDVITFSISIAIVPAGTDVSQLEWSGGVLTAPSGSNPFANVPDGFTYETVYAQKNTNITINIPGVHYIKHVVYNGTMFMIVGTVYLIPQQSS